MLCGKTAHSLIESFSPLCAFFSYIKMNVRNPIKLPVRFFFNLNIVGTNNKIFKPYKLIIKFIHKE